MDSLRPFIITAAHSGKEDLADLEPAVREVYTKSDLSQDPNRSNVFMFVLDPRGRVVHEFHGLPGRGRSAVPGRSDHQAEIQKARAKLKLPEVKPQKVDGPLKGLPDLKAPDSEAPAGVRLFIRQDEPGNSVFSKLPVVEVVPMKVDDWKPLAFAPKGKEIEAEALKRWLVRLYPAGIRAADEQKRFQKFGGTLSLEPAGSDDRSRFALLRGKVRLEKGGDIESAFEGELEVVLTYRHDAAEVRAVHGVVEGTYLYRTRGTSREKLRVAIESRPE
ncbi:MAG TPA: hypothetical protein VKE74_29010 [Gemmataceae bacterium]|nr:hypothetical protein [Gemmataceae bacterium]